MVLADAGKNFAAAPSPLVMRFPRLRQYVPMDSIGSLSLQFGPVFFQGPQGLQTFHRPAGAGDAAV